MHLLWSQYALHSSLHLTYIDLKSEGKGSQANGIYGNTTTSMAKALIPHTPSIDKALGRLLLYVRSGTAQASLQLMKNLDLTAIHGSERWDRRESVRP